MKSSRSRRFPWGILGCLALALSLMGQTGPVDPAQPPEQGPSPDAVSNVYVIPISDYGDYMVDDALVQFLRRAVKDAVDKGADLLVFRIDTFGGLVSAAWEISDLLMGIEGARTVAYVETKAISAGALISLSCDDVVMKKGTTIGASAPVYQTPEGMEEAGEKTKSVLRARFRSIAESKGFPIRLAEAMVDKELEIHEIVDTDGKRRYVDSVELERLEKEGKIREKYLFKEKGELLTLTSEEAVTLGFARREVQNLEEVLAIYGATTEDVRRLQPTWSESLVRFLGSPAVSAILMLLGILGLYIELNNPGLIVPGMIGLFCFALLFGGKYLAGLAETWEFIVFVVGILLILIEIFFIPGFGVAGVLGVFCVLAGLFLIFIPSMPNREIPEQVEWFNRILYESLGVVLGSSAFALVLLIVLISRLGKIPGLRRVVLATNLSRETGYTLDTPKDAQLVGKTGTVTSPLRPAGSARIEGELYDVVSDGEYIDAGETVTVAESHGNRIVVRRV